MLDGRTIDGFHCDVIKFKTQNHEARSSEFYVHQVEDDLVLIQVYSPVASFVLKIQHFAIEFRNLSPCVTPRISAATKLSGFKKCFFPYTFQQYKHFKY